MTREEIIKKGEKLLEYRYGFATNKDNTRAKTKEQARKGLAQLDMLFYILDEDWEDYSVWFDKFMILY